MSAKPFFPLFVDLSNKRVVIVGGGKTAYRRVRTILKFTRDVTVIAPQAVPEILELGKTGFITLVQRSVIRTDFEMAYMVIAATNDRRLNEEVCKICRELGIYVNVADDKRKCDFYFPGIYMKDDIVVGITANGMDHNTAAKIREAIENVMDDEKEL